MRDNPVLIFSWLLICYFNLAGEQIKSGQNSAIPPVRIQTADSIKMRFTEGILFGSFSKEDGPFLVEGNVMVPSGQMLEFGPGCHIYIGGQNSSITVYGQIFIRGNKDEPVVFNSASDQPNPWDWNRIYCRSNQRSVFNHCIIRHSNYGLVVENGSISIQNTLFENNSIHGLVIKNSEVDLRECTFTSEHISAINLLPGAVLEAESLTIKNNLTAISCHKNSYVKLQGGSITENSNGMIIHPYSSVSILSAQITRNKNGLVTSLEIPRKDREMVFSNAHDLKIVDIPEINKLLRLTINENKLAFARSESQVKGRENFKPGFSALSKPPEPVSDFLGNVTTGFKYFHPRSQKNPSVDSIIHQTHYPEKIQPEIQVFANGHRAGADINLLMDIYGNSWLSTAGYVDKRMFNLSLSYAEQQLVFGDFFENASETSISGRQITGVKYSGQFMNMGAGDKRFDFILAAGESEFPKDSGDHEINIYNETVDTGMSVRQQLTYLASLSVKPTRTSSLSVKGIIARDQTDKPIFRSPLNDPSAPDPVQAQTGCIDGSVSLLQEKLEIFAELDLGTHDTIDSDKAKDVAWYNPDFKHAVPEIFSLFNKKDFQDHYAFTMGTRTSIKGYKLSLSASRIAADYFSAGNPYLETDKWLVSFSTDKQINDRFTMSTTYDYRRASISVSPQDNNRFNIKGEYSIGENKPTFSIDYSCIYEKMTSSERVENDDTTFTSTYEDKAVSNIVAMEAKQNFTNGIDCGLRYQLLYDNDISKHADQKLNNNGDRFQNQLRGWFSFRIKKYLKSKFSVRLATRDEKRDSLEAYSYKLQNLTTWNIIPRKLILNLIGEYNSSSETDIYTYQNPTLASFYKGEMELRYSITSRLSLSVMGSYEKSYDEAPESAENYKALISGINLTCLF